MSLTQGAAVFGAIHEDALNDMLRAYFTARPRYRNFGSPAFTPVTTVTSTRMDAIAFPGVPGGIQWRVEFAIPKVDLFKQGMALPPQVVLGPGQFALTTRVRLCILCSHRRDNRDRSDKPLKGERKPAVDGELCTELGVFAVGHIDSWSDANGNGEVRMRADQVELVDITPDSLESVLECLIRMVLDAMLAEVVLPLQALRAGAFRLVVASGPSIDDNQIKVLGNL
jgi:hypothetical protein